jgi:glycine cleavage system H protein
MGLLTSDDFYGQQVTVDDRYLYYLREHLWVDPSAGGIYRFGVSHAGVILVNGFKYCEYAVTPGETVDADDSVMFVETFKAMINLTAPVAGQVSAINEKLNGEGIKILEEQYFNEMMFALLLDADARDAFLTPEEYMEALLRGDADHCGAGARVMRRNR